MVGMGKNKCKSSVEHSICSHMSHNSHYTDHISISTVSTDGVPFVMDSDKTYTEYNNKSGFEHDGATRLCTINEPDITFINNISIDIPPQVGDNVVNEEYNVFENVFIERAPSQDFKMSNKNTIKVDLIFYSSIVQNPS